MIIRKNKIKCVCLLCFRQKQQGQELNKRLVQLDIATWRYIEEQIYSIKAGYLLMNLNEVKMNERKSN